MARFEKVRERKRGREKHLSTVAARKSRRTHNSAPLSSHYGTHMYTNASYDMSKGIKFISQKKIMVIQ